MTYDLEVIVPVCSRFAQRIEDFKRYGLVNIKNRKVLVNTIASNENIEGIDEGWPKGVDVNFIKSDCPDHISNLYKFYVNLNPDALKAKWLIRLDDDSCTDVDGLLSNLDLFYDWTDKHYLGDLNDFAWAVRVGEVYDEYKHLLGEYEKVAMLLKNEIECGVISHGGLVHILNNEKAMSLLRHRSELRGGHGDCVVALAAALAKFYPTNCPFITHHPLIDEFSLFGGVKNHIHLIARSKEGENFPKAEAHCFTIITKVVDNNPTEMEKKIAGSRFLIETEDDLKIYEFNSNYGVKVKFEDHIFNWMEYDGSLVILDRGNIVSRISIQENGDLLDGETVLRKI